MSNQTKYDAFRQTFPKFVYESYQYDVQPDGLHIVFTFRIADDIVFRPTAFFPARRFLDMRQPRGTLDTLVFNIGMAELISYWKCLCPPTVEVCCGHLAPSQIQFWKKLYFNGLGEFFYTNGIAASADDFLSIVSAPGSHKEHRPIDNGPADDGGILVPIGGGKDSVVSLELLQQATRPTPLIMNPRGATTNCVNAAGYAAEETLIIHRTIHPRLIELNAQGCLNGHTPFSAMLAFYTLLAAQLSGKRSIALSNESSANEATVADTHINHQYSKSLEFENDFRRYVAQHISASLDYFSFLRPLSELQIAMLFSRHEKYFDIFRSCNVGSKQDVWCAHCPKCLFAYIILAPFIPPQRINGIFGRCLLDDPSLLPFFHQLTGRAATKPFECVGTVEEVRCALSMTLDRWYPEHRPCLLADYPDTAPSTALDTLSSNHNVGRPLLDILAKAVADACGSQMQTS